VSEPRVRYLPVMITRIMLSLKKAAASQGDRWSLGESSVFTDVRIANFRSHNTADDAPITLKTLRSKDRQRGSNLGMMS